MRSRLPTLYLIGLLTAGMSMSLAAHDDEKEHYLGDIDKVNASIRVKPQSEAGNLDTVNGDIEVGDDGRTKGMSTVNGNVEVGKNVRARSAETVNGKIHVGDGSHFSDELETVNGDIRLGKNTQAHGVSTVNGAIDLGGTLVARNVETVNGNIYVRSGSIISGAVILRKPNNWCVIGCNTSTPEIVIESGAEVATIVLEREAKLTIASGAKVGKVDKQYEKK